MRFHNISIKNILKESLNYEAILVDVRSRDNFAKGHIPMAINVPLELIQEGHYSLQRGKVLIVYCENGGSSTRAARILSEKGFKVINTIGGLHEYKGAITKNR